MEQILDLYTKQIWPPDTVIELRLSDAEMAKIHFQQQDFLHALEFFAERLRALGAPVFVSKGKTMYPSKGLDPYSVAYVYSAPPRLDAAYGKVTLEHAPHLLIYIVRWTAS